MLIPSTFGLAAYKPCFRHPILSASRYEIYNANQHKAVVLVTFLRWVEWWKNLSRKT